MKKRLVLTLAAASLTMACASTMQTVSIFEAYKKYQIQDFQGTLTLINRAETIGGLQPAQLAELTYLKALSYESLGETGISQTLFAYIVEQHPETQYAYLGRQKLDEAR